MSVETRIRRMTTPEIRARKGGEPLVVLTAYTAPMAGLLDEACDILLVGDSLGMVVYGFDSTLPVTLDMMINHGAAVVRGSRKACVVIDMPFASYEQSKEQAYENAARIMAETGAHAVKLEGGEHMAETINFLVRRGIPVQAHVGLTPQSVHVFGGFKTQGRNEETARQIMADAIAVQDAGAFSVVIEGVVESLGAEITKELTIPTIGIGASPACDGQVLVVDDMLGMFTDFKPKFVKRYATMAEDVKAAVADYAAEVKSRAFPADEHCFGVKK